MVGEPRRHGWRTRPPLLGRTAAMGRLRLGQGPAYARMGQTEIVVTVEHRQLLQQPVFALAQGADPAPDRGHMLPDGQVDSVTVDRRIAPPTAAPERSMRLSPHAAPQYPDACHAHRAGDNPYTPAFSHRGNVHAALADWQSANRGGYH